MPLYALACPSGHTAEEYCHVPEDRGARTHICACGEAMAHVLSMGAGLTWFESGRPRVLWNLGPEPITVTSHEQHKREMKKAGVDWSTGWKTTGTKGWL